MTAATYAACEKCAGKGTLPHAKRMIGEGEAAIPDPTDHRVFELCDKCGGAGAILYAAPKSVEERKVGFVADI